MGLFDRIFGSRPTRFEIGASHDLTGTWAGYYTQHGQKRPIQAEITQQKERISGIMTDGQTEFHASLFDAAVQSGLPPGADEKIDEQIRKLVPDSGDAPIRAKTILPEQSQLEGTIDGAIVKFTKLYQGQHFVGFEVGDKHVGQVRDHHSVEYHGRLSHDGSAIEGQWTIHAPDHPRGFIDGSFFLQRT